MILVRRRPICRRPRCEAHYLYGYLDGADAIISFCKLKSHGMLSLSAATKNLFGAIPGIIKPEYHYRYPDPVDFADMLIDLNEFFRPRLYLVDAVQTMEGNGPTAGTPKYMGALLAGTNPHKIDLLCAKSFGLEAKNVPTLRAAQERGLTPASAEELEISGDAEEFVCKDFVTVQKGTGTDFGAQKGKLLGAAAKTVLRARPKLKRSRCVGCGVCRNTCPAHAIVIEKGKAKIDRRAGTPSAPGCVREPCSRAPTRVHRTRSGRNSGRRSRPDSSRDLIERFQPVEKLHVLHLRQVAGVLAGTEG